MKRLVALGLAALLALTGCTTFRKGYLEGVKVREEVTAALEKANEIPYEMDGFLRYSWRTASETKEDGKGDCADKSIYVKYLLKKEGIESEVVGGFSCLWIPWGLHAWVEYKENGKEYLIESTYGGIYRKKDVNFGNYVKIITFPVDNEKYMGDAWRVR